MKIGVYNECSQGQRAFDGSERYSASLASALAPSHQVEFVHHKPQLNREHLEQFCGVPLEDITLRYVPFQAQPSLSRNPLGRYKTARNWHKELSEPYDLFVAVVHDLPPFCHAPRGVLITLFPAFDPFYIWPQRQEPLLEDFTARKKVERPYHFWEWKQRLGSYNVNLSISEYVRTWTRRRWGVESQVLYPAGDADFRDIPKEDTILSVGRFAVRGVLKRQMEMTYAFAQMKSSGDLAGNWRYVCAGSTGETPAEDTYSQNVQALGALHGVEVLANVPWDQLRPRYERAKIFWHGAGYGVDESQRPQDVEHFGIVTVEAMAAGCVPVVVRKGGQPEIVQHGVNGFLWNSLDELRQYTAILANNDALRERMSAAARLRAQDFTVQRMQQQFMRQASALLS